MPAEKNLRRTEPHVASFDPLDYWNRLGPGVDLKIIKMGNGMRAYRYSTQDRKWTGKSVSYIIREDGKKITHNVP